jgi:pyrroline-5-carboxylate reductase
VGHADLVIICLEPRQVAGVLAEVRDVLDTANQTIISLAAGISIERIERTVGKSMEIVRAMPNTALRVREAITALATNRPGGSGIELARRLFAFGGTTIDVAEKQLDAVTALGGSGPAFFLTAIQGAITGGVAAGLQPDQARDITLQVIRGAVALVSACSNTPKDEIAEIVTPGGCTAAGLKTLDSAQFEAALSNAIVEAARRAAELGDDAATGRTSDWSHE